MDKNRASLCLIVALILIAAAWTAPAQAGTIDPLFEARIDAAAPGELISGLVVLKDRVDIGPLTASLDAEGASRPTRHTAVVRNLQVMAEENQWSITMGLRVMKIFGLVDDYQAFWITNIISVKARPAMFTLLARHPEVERVAENFPIELIATVAEAPAASFSRGVENGVAVTGAPDLWAVGITGAGSLVCHLDTGVDGNHAALADGWKGLEPDVDPAAAWFDPVTETDFPFDSGSHGTHTMGTICGRSGSDIIGMAWDAKWISAGVIDRVSISQTTEDALLAFEWAADPDGNPGTSDDVPIVVSNSWGLIPQTHGVDDCDPIFWEALDNLEAAGAVVVFAAGNEGLQGLRVPADRNTTPINTFSVGALKQSADDLAGFSSRGPTKCTPSSMKPEVCAVGDDVRSATPSNRYGTKSGTSMACPHVAGAIALLHQYNPEATVDELKTALLDTAVDLGWPGDDNLYGMGSIDVVAAAESLGLSPSVGTLEGEVVDSVTGFGVSYATIELTGTSIRTMTDAAGDYVVVVPGDTTYSIEVSAFGHGSDTGSGLVPAGGSVTVDFALVADPKGTLQGTVTRGTLGSPIEGATVSFTNAPLAAAVTNAAGFYQAEVPGNFSYDLEATADGFDEDRATAVLVPAGGTVVEDFSIDAEVDCPLLAAQEQLGAIGSVEVFREVRDNLLSRTKQGVALRDLYYRHAAEITGILLNDGAIMAEAAVLISKAEPACRALLDATDGRRRTGKQVVLDADLSADILSFFDRVSAQAGSELRTDLVETGRMIHGLSGKPAVHILLDFNPEEYRKR